MKRRFTFGSAELIMFILILPGVSKAQSGIQKISAHIFTRQAENGYKASLEGVFIIRPTAIWCLILLLLRIMSW